VTPVYGIIYRSGAPRYFWLALYGPLVMKRRGPSPNSL
jgi:hypothetical protein